MPRSAVRPTDTFALRGWRVDDRRGQRVGTVEAVYAAAGAPAPAWLLVRLARYPTRYVLAPPADVLSWRGRVSLPWDRLLIERAPLLYAPPAKVPAAMAAELRRHFRLSAVPGLTMTARRTVA